MKYPIYSCTNFLCPERDRAKEIIITDPSIFPTCSSCNYQLVNNLYYHPQEEKTETNSNIDGPEHYGGYQVLELICAAEYGKGFCLGNSIKYLSRALKKGNFKEDILKAQVYLNYYIENELEK